MDEGVDKITLQLSIDYYKRFRFFFLNEIL